MVSQFLSASHSRFAPARVSSALPRDSLRRTSAPVENLYFAGEAASAEHSGAVHGAYSSGLAAAEDCRKRLLVQKGVPDMVQVAAFAGEAASAEHSGAVHGAYSSGLAAAEDCRKRLLAQKGVPDMVQVAACEDMTDAVAPPNLQDVVDSTPFVPAMPD